MQHRMKDSVSDESYRSGFQQPSHTSKSPGELVKAQIRIPGGHEILHFPGAPG